MTGRAAPPPDSPLRRMRLALPSGPQTAILVRSARCPKCEVDVFSNLRGFLLMVGCRRSADAGGAGVRVPLR